MPAGLADALEGLLKQIDQLSETIKDYNARLERTACEYYAEPVRRLTSMHGVGTLDVRFFERGAGFAMSSGTGSTGAFAAACARALVDDEVTVRTLAGDLALRYENGHILLQGPAEIVAGGEFYLSGA
ncbi:MAG: hypothetical protein KJZ84_16865 [Bryobacteraceae bacterium]|nr:hypothetical protein [Bryobacteraceae bacterium]